MTKKIFILLFTFLAVTWQGFAQQNMPQGQGQAQGMSQSDMSQMKVDQLRDVQIKQLFERGISQGLTEDQVVQMAQQRGLPSGEANKLKVRYEKIKAQGGAGEGSAADGLRDSEDLFKSITQEDYDPEDEEEIKKEKRRRRYERKLFGHDLFAKDKVTFEPSQNIPVPPNYQVGPGDQVIIDIWGASQNNITVNISPEGFIKIPNLGPIQVSGLTIEEATQRITYRLSEIYSGISPGRPSKANTYVMVSLGNLRSLKVTVIGDSKTPGSYTLPSFSTVFNALYLSGGPNINGSLRNIQVIRNNQVFETLDVYDFLVDADLSKNVYLRDQDIIKINTYQKRAEIAGEIRRPGIYELSEEESIKELIHYAGGFKDDAFKDMVKVYRKGKKERAIFDLEESEFENFTVLDGDSIFIEPVLKRFSNRVQITGAVFRPGQYELDSGLTILKLIKKAEGLTGDAFINRATIYRSADNFSMNVIPFSLEKLVKGEIPDILLEREDWIRISSIFELKEEYYVTIDGEILEKGTFPYFTNMTLEDLIVKAGGLTEAASKTKVEIARRVVDSDIDSRSARIAETYEFTINENLDISDEASTFVLKPFDRVFVRRAPGFEPQQVITVDGEVRYPGKYAIKRKNERISDVLMRTGGLTREAFPEGATLIRRTQYNIPESEDQIRLKKLIELEKKDSRVESQELFNRGLTESEERRKQRIAALRVLLEDENRKKDSPYTAILRQRLKELETKTAEGEIVEANVPMVQPIGINLNKIIEKPGSKYDLILQDGDFINIPRELQTVRLSGEVLYPITVRYEKTSSLKSYIAQSGGFSSDAKRRKTYVIYANGAVDRTRNFVFFNSYPNVEPGAEVIVPAKPPREPVRAADFVGIIGSLAGVAATLSLVFIRVGGN